MSLGAIGSRAALPGFFPAMPGAHLGAHDLASQMTSRDLVLIGHALQAKRDATGVTASRLLHTLCFSSGPASKGQEGSLFHASQPFGLDSIRMPYDRRRAPSHDRPRGHAHARP
jgi:hypothetical protein